MQRIADIMTREVEIIAPDATVQRAAQKMDDLNVGSLPVCNGEKVLGMITDRDITVRVTSVGKAPDQVKVEEVMSADLVFCYDDDDIAEVSERMAASQVRRIPVISRDTRKLVGIVALGDLATKQSEVDVDETLSDISYPAQPDRPQAGTQR